MSGTKPEPVLWLSDARGIYIPRDFAKSFTDRDARVAGVSAEDWAILEAGPEADGYWDTWDLVIQNALVTDEAGRGFRIYQEGDCWLVPRDMEWDSAEDWWRWPVDADEAAEQAATEGDEA